MLGDQLNHQLDGYGSTIVKFHYQVIKTFKKLLKIVDPFKGHLNKCEIITLSFYNINYSLRTYHFLI